MDTRCFLRTLGLPALFGPAGEAIRFRVKKHLAVLVYLGVEPRVPLRREFLADLLWPTATAGEGRHSLATALSVLRTRLGRAALETTRDVVRLTGTGLLVDLERLASGDVLGDEVRAPLEVGGFLDGFDVPDADEFMRWKERQQARLLPAILEAMVKLIDRCRRTADSRQMERIADRMIGLDPLSEDAIRAKMEARAFAGDRVTALRVFEEWKEQLARELGAAPSTTVDGLASRLRRRGWERTDGPPVPPIATEQWRNRPFIGRMSEYRVLYEQWERVRKGEPGHVLVRGDSGIGKTTIVERLSTAAALEGAGASRVQCYELEREIPYAGVTGLVIGLLEKPGAAAAPPDALAELSRTVPEVRQRFPSIPPSIDSQGETARIRLTEALHDLTSAIAEEHPVILIVDDLHLADDASLAVLHLLIRRAVGQPIMLVLTVRPGELGRSPQALRLLESATSLGFREVELSPLSEAEASEFLDSVVPPGEPRPGAAARRALLAAGAGYPMVLELLVSDWHRNGERSLALSLGAMTADLHSGDRAQAGPYDAVFERILQSLDPTARAVLNLAAILGHRLNSLPMYGIVELGLGQAMHGLSELAKVRVLRDAGQRLEFLNELIRACAYRAVPSPVRRELHSAVADWLIGRKAGVQEVLGLEVAWHCMRAARLEEAIPHLLAGAREALRSGAPHEAERALSTGLPSLPERPATEARLLLAETLQEQGRWDESLEPLAAVQNDPSAMEDVLVLQTAARIQEWSMTAAELRAAVDTMTQLAANTKRSITSLRAAQVAAAALNDLRDPSAAQALLNVINGLPADDFTDEEWLNWALAKAQALFFVGDRKGRGAEMPRLMAHASSSRVLNSTTVRLMMAAGATKVARGEYEEAVPYHQEAFQMAVRLGRDGNAASSASNLAICHLRLGNVAQQLHWAEKSLSIGERHSSNNARLHAMYCRALALISRGDQHLARQYVEEITGRVHPRLPEWMREMWQLYRADVLASLGAVSEARECARGVIGFEHLGPKAGHYLGVYARWCAFVADKGTEQHLAHGYLSALVACLDDHDCLDQAEILAGWLMTADVRDSGTVGQALAERLAKLPGGVTIQLRRLGMLR